MGGAVVGWFGLGRSVITGRRGMVGLNACPTLDRLNGSARFCTTFSALYMYVSKKFNGTRESTNPNTKHIVGPFEDHRLSLGVLRVSGLCQTLSRRWDSHLFIIQNNHNYS